MVIDTSAVMAILRDEPERRRFSEAIEAADSRCMSTASFVEASIVLEARLGREAVHLFDLLLAKAEIEQVAVDTEQARLAREAFRAYGRGRHRAGLNFGDCFAYALAKARGEPLLFKGEDFSETDLASAL